MYTDNSSSENEPANNSPDKGNSGGFFGGKQAELFSWELILVMVGVFAALAIFLERPSGSLEGCIALEQKSFGLYSYDIRKNMVNAVVTGPRYGSTISRGVWLDKDGRFAIHQLPVGEYTMSVKAPGFETRYLSSVFVEAGKVNKLQPIKMEVLEPDINLSSNMRVFTSKEKPRFSVSARGATEATVRIYKRDFLQTLSDGILKKAGVSASQDLSFYKSYGAKFHDPFAHEQPIKSLKRGLQASYTDSARANFQLDESLPPGDYFVVASATGITGKKTASDLWWFNVSDIGLVVKHAPDRTLVRAVDLLSLAPKAGVEVKLFSSSNTQTPVVTGTTDASGCVMLEGDLAARRQIGSNLLVTGSVGDQRAYGGTYYWMGSSSSYKTYFYTDRPIYRLGQTVNFKGMVRESTNAGYANPGARASVHLSIDDPTGENMKELNLASSAHGTFNGSYIIPEDAKTGFYQVRIDLPGGSTSYQSFEVGQYRKPEYKVEIKPEKSRITAGNKLKAVISAEYFFGAPVSNAQIKYSIFASPDWSTRYKLMPRPDYCSFFDDWDEYGNSNYGSYGGSFIAEGTATTDNAGQAVVEIETNKLELGEGSPSSYWEYQDKSYRIEAEVTDISRLTCSGSAQVTVSAGDFALFVEPSSYVIQAGESINARITARGYDGKPAAGKKVSLRVARWPYNSLTRTSSEKVLATVNLVTDAQGNAETAVKIMDQWPTDSFYLSARAQDDNGNTVMDTSSVWVSNSRIAYKLDDESSKKTPFKLSLDKQIYQQGDKARLLISGPFKGDEGFEALVTVEGNSLYSHRIVPLKSSAVMVEIPIDKRHVPNGYIGVTMVAKNKQLYNESKLFMVSPAENFLELDISTDKERYKPGESITYTIKASDGDGKPAAQAELSMAVVDESIYSVRPEAAPDIKRFFFDRKPNKVTTLTSFPEQYSGGPDKAGVNPSVRKNFKDTAAWLPSLVTDERGMVKTTIILPDNLTTWRATVRAIDMNARVGSAMQKSLVTQDIIARLALPRFFTEGDRASVSAIVHNYSPTDQDIKLTLAMSDHLRTNIPLSRTLRIARDGSERFSWPVEIVKDGQASIELKAIGTTAGDALSRTLAIKSLGIPMYDLQAGVLTNSRPSVDITPKLPGQAIATAFSLSLASSTLAQISGSYDYLIDYPYGCTEQTVSRLVPSAIAMQLHARLGLPLKNESMARFAKVEKLAIERLESHQHYDGGWGWWKDDSSDPYMTTCVLDGLKLLSESGIKPAKMENMVKSGLTWLEKNHKTLLQQLQDPKLIEDYTARERRTDLVRMINTLVAYGKSPSPQAIAWLRSQKEKMMPEPLAYSTIIFHSLNEPATARSFYARLLELANKSGSAGNSTMDWEHSRALLEKLKLLDGKKNSGFSGFSGIYDYTYRFTGEETTALALRAMLLMEEPGSDAVESVKQWLLLNRGKDGWANTKTTAAVLQSLLEDALLTRATTGEQSTLGARAFISGENNEPAEILASVMFAPVEKLTEEKRLALGSTNNPAGPSRFRLDKDGAGNLYYRARLDFNARVKAGEEPPVASLPEGLSLKREFFRLERASANNNIDGSIHLKARPVETGSIKAGETILMKVTVEAPISLPYTMVECPLPSGAEVINSQERLDATDSFQEEDSGISGDWGSVWWNHQDILDDKIVFFGAHIPQGKSTFHTLLRMELPGQVQLNPVTLEGMYTDRIKAYSRSAILGIREQGK